VRVTKLEKEKNAMPRKRRFDWEKILALVKKTLTLMYSATPFTEPEPHIFLLADPEISFKALIARTTDEMTKIVDENMLVQNPPEGDTRNLLSVTVTVDGCSGSEYVEAQTDDEAAFVNDLIAKLDNVVLNCVAFAATFKTEPLDDTPEMVEIMRKIRMSTEKSAYTPTMLTDCSLVALVPVTSNGVKHAVNVIGRRFSVASVIANGDTIVETLTAGMHGWMIDIDVNHRFGGSVEKQLPHSETLLADIHKLVDEYVNG